MGAATDQSGGRARPDVTRAGHGTRLYLLARALGEALTPDQVASVVFDEALQDLGASTVGLWLVESDEIIRFAGGAGHRPGHGPELVGDIPLDSDLPAAVCVRSGDLISYATSAERDIRWPQLEGISSEAAEMVVVVPLEARDRRIGVLHIGWLGESPDFRPDEAFLAAAGDLCAAALDRAGLYQAERRARETLEFLNQATRIMVSALDPDEIVRAIVRLAVPHLAPWCGVYVAERGFLHRVAVEIEGEAELANELRASPGVPVDSDVPLAQVFRSGRTQILRDLSADVVRHTYPADTAERVVQLEGPWSGFVLPVQSGGQVIGVMSLLSRDWHGRPPAEARYAAEGLAARAGVALHNARRYREQVDNVLVLTAALLPEGVPRLPGLDFAARYAPASGGVCGDWYEAEALTTGSVLVGIGDAAGHGLPAAASMSHVRNAARGLAVAGLSAGRMMESLSALTIGGVDRMATTIYGLLDPATGAASWANAGHPPPIVVDAQGRAAAVPMVPGPPLGTGVGTYAETRADVPAGGKFVLYTDGLFERRGEDPLLGIQRLVDLVADMAKGTAGELADTLIAARPEGDDDACVLVIGR